MIPFRKAMLNTKQINLRLQRRIIRDTSYAYLHRELFSQRVVSAHASNYNIRRVAMCLTTILAPTKQFFFCPTH